MRDRGDRRQRFAAESHRPDRREIVGTANLARGVALYRKPRVFRLHAFAVVLDPYVLLAAELGMDRDALRAGVDRVFDQFLDHRRRALDDLAGGDLVREIV